MDKDKNKLDALRRRREFLSSLAVRRRILSSSATPKQHENKVNDNILSNDSHSSDVIDDSDVENHNRRLNTISSSATLKQHENKVNDNILSNDSHSSDVIDDSDVENHNRRLNTISSSTPKQHELKGNKNILSIDSNNSNPIADSDVENERQKMDVTRIVNSSGDSNESCNTSTFSLPLTHVFFGKSPLKLDKTCPLTQTKPKIRVISSEVIVPASVTIEKNLITSQSSYNMQHNNSDPVCRPTIKPNFSVQPEVELYSDNEHLDSLLLPKSSTIQLHIPPETEKSLLATTSHEPKQFSDDFSPTAADVCASLSPEVKEGLTKTEPDQGLSTKELVAQLTPTKITTGDNNLCHATFEDTSKGPVEVSHSSNFIIPVDGSLTSQNTCHQINCTPTLQPSYTSPSANDNAFEYLSPDRYLYPVPGPSHENKMTNTPSRKKRQRRTIVNKAHVDFLSDDEQKDFSAGSSDSWSNHESDISSDEMDTNKKKKKKRKKKMSHKEVDHDKEAAVLIKKKEKRPNLNKLKKKSKDEGKAYVNSSGLTKDAKKMKENPCQEKKCVKRCYEIAEERRCSLFNHFWSLDSLRRKDWILRCVRKVAIKRKRTSTPESRRTATYEYFINEGEDHRKVCQKFLTNTLDITQKYLIYTIQNAEEDMASGDKRKPNVPQKYNEASKKHVDEFIEKLPLLPSHYNRPKTERMYLPPEYQSVLHIYRTYIKDCQLTAYQPVSEAVFRQIFNEYNISIHTPKKDKCKTCTAHKNNKESISEKMKTHIEEKNSTYRRFKAHQNLTVSKNDTITTSFDLQKVLNTPYGESMLLYYSRKYAVYNFTLYESGTQEVFCYTWGESDGRRGGNEIATCLEKYLQNIDDRGIKNLLLYCDSCTGQNKNKIVLTLLNSFLKTSRHLNVIQINYLLPGHTYMPVDSVHAVIEREVRKLIVWSPSQWPTYFQSARKNPRPYKVEVLDHSDFFNYEELAETIFTAPIMKRLRISKLRTATLKKKYPDQIRAKYSMGDAAEEICIMLGEEEKNTKTCKGQRKGKSKGKGKGKSKANTELITKQEKKDPEIKPAYSARLPISSAKYKDLMRLCKNGTIPKAYHNEYRQIPNEDNVMDYFPYTDDDQNEEDDKTD